MAASLHASGTALALSIDIGVVGAGAMGAGIAQVAAAAGHTVLLFDVRDSAAKAAVDGIGTMLSKLVAKGKMQQEQAAAAKTNLRAVETLPELAGCGLVIEAIVEDLDAKRGLFRELEAIVPPQALLATNTSSISITSIAAVLQHPERLAGMHFFNPAPLMPLVEVISGAATSDETAATLHATAAQWGKVPVYARSTPGFIVNRVARPFYAEALRVLQEGAADCATIDAVMRELGGFRMGPFELMDLIGNDVNYAVTRSVFDGFYGDPRFTPSLLQLELVQAGFLGRKTGRGFYHYGADSIPAPPSSAAPAAMPAGVRLYRHNGLTARLAKANLPIEHTNAHDDGRIADCGPCVLYQSDGRTAAARAVVNGVPNTILIDLALDPATAKRIAISAADTCEPAALASAVGLFQAAGFAVSVIDDIPGMIVLRTVAMLINEAADAVNQGVCSAADCDLAMRKGVNYPRGPLEWADHLGLKHVVTVLENLMQSYGEDRYRVSPLLRRKALAGAQFHNDREQKA